MPAPIPGPPPADAAASVPSLRTLGTGATQAMAGNTTISLTGGADNRIAIWNGTSALKNNPNLLWDSVNSRLSVGGATTPLGILSVRGVGTTTGVTFRLEDSTATAKFTVLDNGEATFAGVLTASNLGGTNTGDVTLAAIGATPNASGASLSGQILTLQPASTSFAGLLLAADKTKLDATTGTNSGDFTLATIGATPNANGASLTGQVLTLQPADATSGGVLTTIAQTIPGPKTFSGAGVFSATLVTTGVLSPNGGIQRSSAGTLTIGDGANDTALTVGKASQTTTIGGTLALSSALLSGASPGTSGQVLTSAGAGAVPTWTTGATGTVTGTGSSGALAFWTGASVLSEDPTQLFWDNTGNRLGIGKNAALGFSLDVVGGAKFTAGIWVTSTDAYLRLSSSATASGSYVSFANSTDAEKAKIGYGNSGAAAPFAGNLHVQFMDSSADFVIIAVTTETARFKNNGDFYVDTNTLYVDAINNRVGVGLSGPTAKLQVKGNGTTTGVAFLVEDSAGTDRLSVLDNGTTVFSGDVTVSGSLNQSIATNQTPFLQHSDIASDFVVSGLLGTDPGAVLAMTTPAGVAYVTGLRVIAAANVFTFAASSDTYVDLSNAGVFTYVAVANGAGEPGVTANSLRIEKVVTNATEITAVTQTASVRVTFLDPIAVTGVTTQTNAIEVPTNTYLSFGADGTRLRGNGTSILSTGSISPTAANKDLGTGADRWSTLYASIVSALSYYDDGGNSQPAPRARLQVSGLAGNVYTGRLPTASSGVAHIFNNLNETATGLTTAGAKLASFQNNSVEKAFIDKDGAITSGNVNTYGGETGITAFAGGGQASATALTKEVNFVTVVATAADSVKLPVAVLGQRVVVFNLDAADSVNIFPVSGSAIDALAADAAYALAAGASREFWGQSATQWRSK